MLPEDDYDGLEHYSDLTDTCDQAWQYIPAAGINEHQQVVMLDMDAEPPFKFSETECQALALRVDDGDTASLELWVRASDDEIELYRMAGEAVIKHATRSSKITPHSLTAAPIKPEAWASSPIVAWWLALVAKA